MEPAPKSRWPWILATLVVVGGAAVLRFRLNFATVYPPATDAASIGFSHGRLMYDDPPLLFWLNIAFTKSLNLMRHPLEILILLLRDTAAFPLPGMGPNIKPGPLKPPAQRVYPGKYIEVYEIPNL